jgi:hypothetical protein
MGMPEDNAMGSMIGYGILAVLPTVRLSHNVQRYMNEPNPINQKPLPVLVQPPAMASRCVLELCP